MFATASIFVQFIVQRVFFFIINKQKQVMVKKEILLMMQSRDAKLILHYILIRCGLDQQNSPFWQCTGVYLIILISLNNHSSVFWYLFVFRGEKHLSCYSLLLCGLTKSILLILHRSGKSWNCRNICLRLVTLMHARTACRHRQRIG